MNKEYHYNRTGRERKSLVEAVSYILNQTSVYQKAPTFAYKVGAYTIDKTGTLICSDNAVPRETNQLLIRLQELNFLPEEWAGLYTSSTDKENNHFTITVPADDLTDAAYMNLLNIIDSKSALLKLALNTDSLEVRRSENSISFPWFTLCDEQGEALAYSQLIESLIDMAKRQKRVIAKEKPIENAKFSMRLFLIRLGFIGDEYKTARKILLKNLTGNSAWKAGQPPENRQETANIGVTVVPVPTPVEANYEKGGVPYEP